MRQAEQIKYRISKSEGKLMTFVGLIFDLLPLIGILLVIVFSIQTIANGNWAVSDYVYHSQKADEWCGKKADSWSIVNWERCLHHSRRRDNSLVYAGGMIAAFGIGGAVLMGPAIYVAVSFISSILAYCLFTIWFASRKINIWSFSKPGKLLTTLMTLVMENITLIDLLPGTTILVWRHVKVSRIEDRVSNKEAQSRLATKEARASRRYVPRYRKAQAV